MLLGTIDLDPLTGVPRFTFGTLTLLDGLDLTAVVMGLFGVAEVLLQLEESQSTEILRTPLKGLLPSRQDWRESAAPIERANRLGQLNRCRFEAVRRCTPPTRLL